MITENFVYIVQMTYLAADTADWIYLHLDGSEGRQGFWKYLQEINKFC